MSARDNQRGLASTNMKVAKLCGAHLDRLRSDGQTIVVSAPQCTLLFSCLQREWNVGRRGGSFCGRIKRSRVSSGQLSDLERAEVLGRCASERGWDVSKNKKERRGIGNDRGARCHGRLSSSSLRCAEEMNAITRSQDEDSRAMRWRRGTPTDKRLWCCREGN